MLKKISLVIVLLIMLSGCSSLIEIAHQEGDICVKPSKGCYEIFYEDGYNYDQIVCSQGSQRVCVVYNESVWAYTNDNILELYKIIDNYDVVTDCAEGCRKWGSW